MASMFHEESLKQLFLDHNERHSDYLGMCRQETGTKRQKRRTRWLIFFLIISHIPMIMAIILLLWMLSKYALKQECVHPELVPCKYQLGSNDGELEKGLAKSSAAPVRSANAIKYELRSWAVSFLASNYAGDPSPEIDLAWHNLFEDVNILVKKQNLAAVKLTSIPLADGDYVAQLGVYHELHCIKKVRQWIFRDYYVPDISQEERDEWAAHINHCIEMLRVSAMCRGDTSLSTFSWIKKGDRRYPTATDTGPHQCVNWESLAGWVKERSVNISDPTTLAHPEHATD